MERTSGPWVAEEGVDYDDSWTITGQDNGTDHYGGVVVFSDAGVNGEANAQFIIQAANSYDALMEGLGLDPSPECYAEYTPERLKAEGTGLRMLVERRTSERDELLAACIALVNNPITSGSSAHYRDYAADRHTIDPLAWARAAIAKARGE